VCASNDVDKPCKITYGNATGFTTLCEAKNGTVHTASTGFGCIKDDLSILTKATQFFVDDMPACIPKSCKSDEEKTAQFGNIVDFNYGDFYFNRCEVAYSSSASTFDLRVSLFFAILSCVGTMVL